MAISQDASTPAVASATGSTALTLTTASFSPPAGSLLVAVVSFAYLNDTATGPTLALSDSASGTWTAGPYVYDTAADAAGIWTRPCVAAPGSVTVTVTDSGAASQRGWTLAVYVLDGTAAVQVGAGNATAHSATAVTGWTGSITTTTAGSWVLIGTGGSTTATVTPNGSTSTLNNTQDSPEGASLLAGKQTSATGTPGATTLGWTSGTAGKYAWAALEILPPGIPPPGSTPMPPRRKLRRAVIGFKPAATTNGAPVVPPAGTVQPLTAVPAPRRKPRRATVGFKPAATTNQASAAITIVNQWAATFTQPTAFGTTPPALESVVVALNGTTSVGGGTGTPTAGNWLFCLVAINERTTTAGYTVAVNDDIRSFWRPGNVTTSTAAVSTGTALTRTAIWYAANIASAAQDVYVAPNGSLDALAVLVVEVNGLGPWDTVTGINTNYAAAATSLPLSLGAPSAQAFIIGAVSGDSTTAGQAFAPGGWHTLHTTSVTDGSDHLCDAVLTSAWTQTAGAVSVTGTAASAADLSGVLLGVLTSAPSPVPANQNPNWPYMKTEAAFGSGFHTPPDQRQWTDITARTWAWDETTGIQYQLGQIQATNAELELDNFDGALTPAASAWSFTASGTPVANNYFIVTTAQSASIAVNNAFYDTTNPGTLFTVTSLSAPSGGFVNVFFSPPAGTAMNNPDVVSQAALTTGTPVRIRAAAGTIAGATFNRWYVIARNMQEWPQEINEIHRRYLPVSATDIWSALSAGCFTPYRGEVYADSPYAWWPCDDGLLAGGVQPASLRNAALGNTNTLSINAAPGGVSAADNYTTNGFDATSDSIAHSQSNPVPPGVAVASAAQQAGWMYGDPQSSVTAYATSNPVTANPGSAAWQQSGGLGTTGNNGWFLTCNDASFPALNGGTTFSFWFNCGFFGTATGYVTSGGANDILAGQPDTSITLATLMTASAPVAILQLDTSGHLSFISYSGTTPTSHSVYSTSDLRSASWHQITLTATTSAWTCYVDGGLTATASGSGLSMTSAWTWLALNADFGNTHGGSGLSNNVHSGNVAYSHIQVYAGQLPAWRILAHYCAAVTAFGLLPAPQTVALTQVGNNLAALGGPATYNATPDGSESSGSYGKSGSSQVSYSFSAVAVSQAGSYNSGPSARAAAGGAGGFATGAFGYAVWVGWTGVFPLVAIYTSASANAETNAATACGSGDSFTTGFGASASGHGVCQTASGTGASPPSSASALGDTAGQRIERILGYAQSTYPGRCIDPAPLAVQAATDIGGQAAANNITNIARSDGGMLYIDTQGNLTYWQKSHLAAQYSTPAWTLGPNANGAAVIPYARTMRWTADPQRVWNFITITPFSPDGTALAVIVPTSATSVNSSQSQYGAQPLQITSYLQSTTEMQSQADFLFTNFGQLQVRAEGILVDAASYPAAWGLVLGASVGDVVSVQNWQIGGGGTTGTFRISSIRRRIRFGGQDGRVEGSIEIQADFEPSSYWT